MANENSVAELIIKIVSDSSEVRKALLESTKDVEKFSKMSQSEQKQAASVTSSSANTIQNAMDKSTEKTNHFSNSLRGLSRNLAFLGSAMVGSVIGPMALASKSSTQVALAMRGLSDTSSRFSREIALAAIPTVESFTKWLSKLTDWVEKLPKGLKENIVNVTAWSGAILIGLGSLTKLMSILTKLGELGKIPLVARIFGLTGSGLAVGAAAVGGWKLGEWIGDVTGLNEALSGENGLFTKMFMWMDQKGISKKIDDVGASIKKMADDAKAAIAPVTQGAVDLGKIVIEKASANLKSPQGAQSAPIKKTKEKSFLEKEIGSGFELGLREAAEKFGNWGRNIQEMTANIALSMQNSFSNFFFDAFTGQLKDAKEYVAEFGKSILRMIADLIAKMIAYFIIRAMLKAIGVHQLPWETGATKHEGGLVGFGGIMKKAHEGLNPGEVPIIAQAGEGVLSRNGMATLGSVDNLGKINAGESMGGTQVFLQQTIRAFGPEDIWRERKNIAGAMIEELMANGAFRGAVRKYS